MDETRLLTLHPDAAGSPATCVAVTVARPRAGLLVLTYAVAGEVGAMRLPPAAPAARAGGLWEATCCEAFIRPAPGGPYWEFNFAPSTRWAAWRFDGYRAGMRPEAGIAAVPIALRAEPDRLTLTATLDLAGVLGLAGAPAWRLGLAAVIEDAAGGHSHWALAHPPGRPDFHHPDGFAHASAAPSSS